MSQDAFTVEMSFGFDAVTVPRHMPKQYWIRVGWGTVNHLATKRQRRLCDRNDHPRLALVHRNGTATCARCARTLPPSP